MKAYMYITALTVLFAALALKNFLFSRSLLERNDKLEADYAALAAQIPDIKNASGFWAWPKPSPGKSYFFLILSSVSGKAIMPENPNASYHIAYDLVARKYVALQNTNGAWGGRDFIIEVRGEPDGSVSMNPHKGARAEQIVTAHNIAFGSTR